MFWTINITDCRYITDDVIYLDKNIHYPTLYDFVLFYFSMRKELQLVKYLRAVLFVSIERVFLAGSSLSNTQIGVVGGMYSKKSGNAVIQSNRLILRSNW